jgi:guanosine-3',5'-bis(diphosphate) 3'-pyrophosphohydrolase
MMGEDIRNRSEVFLELVKGEIIAAEYKKVEEVCQVIANEPALDEAKINKAFDIALIIHREMELGVASINCSLLYETGLMDKVQMEPNSQLILDGLEKVKELYSKKAAIETENFRMLLLTFAQDIRVVLIMVAERLWVMRKLKDYSEEEQVKVATETSYLYTPLVHRMGLYAIKSELEDLALKFTNR